MTIKCAVAAMLALLVATEARAHGGGLDANGCHRDRKAGTRHCHLAPARSAPSTDRPQRLAGDRVYYANCSAARAAGAAPVRRGASGYGRHLDRDGDGVGCE